MRISTTTATTLLLSSLPLSTLATPNPNPQGGVGAAGGNAAPLPDPTQMSPTTIYQIHGVDGNKTPVPYTQLFSAVPEQWPEPTQGVIGLGTIQGNVGVVRTSSKRAVALPTARAVLEKRQKKKGGTSAGESGAQRVGLGFGGVGVLVGLAVGVGVVFGL